MKNKYIVLLAIVVWSFTACLALQILVSSNISFWFDPARDLLNAWANLSKVSLIGPPSGIPGFFYGPYWIWWLSLGLRISKNPAIVTGIAITIPYFVIFAGVLWLFSRLFGKITSILLWLLYFLSFQGNMTQLWNPYLAPILFLTSIYILTFHIKRSRIFFAGILSGIALNIHISFSVGFIFGCIAYFLITCLSSKEKIIQKIKQLFFFVTSFCSGVVITFFPFIIFETRHGFHQTKIFMNALLHGGDVVMQHGFSKMETLQEFIVRLSQLVQMPLLVASGVLLVIAILFLVKRKKEYTLFEKNLLLLLASITFCFLAVYLIAKNPIWDYYFIGAEVLWLLLIGFFAARLRFVRYGLFIWIIVLVVGQANMLITSFHQDPLTQGSLFTKEYIVKTIQTDAAKQVYTVYVYSISIYTYEYDYLFRWITGHEFSYDPRQIQRKGIVYLILPKGWHVFLDDFTQNHTPDKLYTTTKIWHIPDGTTILRRSPRH